MMEENKIETTEVTNERPVNTKNKKNMKGIIVLVASVLVLAFGLYYGYKKFLSPKSQFIKAVNKEYKKVEKYIDDFTIDNSDSKPVLVTSDLNFNLNVDDSLLSDDSSKTILSELNKLGLKSQIGIDSKNMEALVKFNALYDNKSLLNMNGYFKDNSIFIELKDLYDKYIEVPLEMETTGMFDANSTSLKNVTKDDLKYLVSKTKDAILNNLNEKDFKKSTDKVKINGKEVKVTKLTYSFSEKTTYELAKGALNSISNDSKFIKILAKISGTKEDEIKQSLQASAQMFGLVDTKELDKTTTAKLSVYTKGVSGISLEAIDEESGKTEIAYYHNDDNYVFNVSENDKNIVTINVNDKNINALIDSEGEKIKLNINKEEKDKTIVYNYTLETDDSKIKGKLTEEIIKKNDDGTGEFKITSEASTMGVSAKITGNLKIEFKDKLELPNTKNSIKYDEIPEEDSNEISNKLAQNSVLVSLIEKFIPEYEENVY